MAITGKIRLIMLDELNDPMQVTTWELNGDLADREELEAWKALKVNKFLASREEPCGWEWDESLIRDSEAEEAEMDALYQEFLTGDYLDFYGEDWDPIKAAGDPYPGPPVADATGGVFDILPLCNFLDRKIDFSKIFLFS